MALTQLSIRPGPPRSVNAENDGSVFTNNGPDSVYYGGQNVTSADGTEITSGSSATLTGTQYLVLASTSSLAKVSIVPSFPAGGDGSIANNDIAASANIALSKLATTGALSATSLTLAGGASGVTTLGASGAVTFTKATGTGLAVTANQTVGGTLTITGLTTSGGLALTDATDVTIATGTGSKVGQASSKIGFYGATPAAKPTGVAVDAAGIHAALVTLGLIGV